METQRKFIGYRVEPINAPRIKPLVLWSANESDTQKILERVKKLQANNLNITFKVWKVYEVLERVF